jgi:hypothetical protein
MLCPEWHSNREGLYNSILTMINSAREEMCLPSVDVIPCWFYPRVTNDYFINTPYEVPMTPSELVWCGIIPQQIIQWLTDHHVYTDIVTSHIATLILSVATEIYSLRCSSNAEVLHLQDARVTAYGDDRVSPGWDYLPF